MLRLRFHIGPFHWRSVVRAVCCWAAGVVLLGAVGCGPPRPKYPAALNAERPDDRIWAIQKAGQLKDRDVLGILVDRLGDEDPAVRMYTIVALERITGTRLGYAHHGPEVERRRAMERWRRYVSERAGEAATRPAQERR